MDYLTILYTEIRGKPCLSFAVDNHSGKVKGTRGNRACDIEKFV